MKIKVSTVILHFLAVGLGTAIYAFGFVAFNMANHLAAGGVAGISLLLHFLANFDPSYSTMIINIPLLIIGYKFLGRKIFIFTVWGIVSLSLWTWLFQRIPINFNIHHDMLVASLLAGVFAGTGVGIVFRFGGTTGGADIVAKLVQAKKGVQVGRTIFMIDSFVLLISLSYINLEEMMYTLIASFVAAQVIGVIQSGGYSAKGILIISNKHEEIAQLIINEFGRSATYLHGEGAYSGNQKEVLYVVLNPTEIHELRQSLTVIDPNIFASVINIHEVVGDFTYPASPYKIRRKKIKKLEL